MPRVIARIRTMRRADGGFTLIELLVAMAISMIVASAALTLLMIAVQRSGEIDQRVDSTQRGRMLMDTVTRQLRSQICMTTDVPPVRQTTATGGGSSLVQSISFYSDLTDGRANPLAPELRTLTYDAAAKTVTETVQPGAGAPPAVTYGGGTTRVVGTNVVQDTDPAGNPIPIFRYYGFTTATDTVPATPTLALPAAMAMNDASVKMIAKVDVRFRMIPTARKAATRSSTAFADDVYVRAADPNDPAPMPTCA
jgi:prepilin-type N-terminal cleavage/methylation domain-containing protein